MIDTIAWEGYREGVDDIRYGTTLKLAIAKARQSGDADSLALAEQANAWLENVDVERCDLDEVRLEMIRYILRVGGQPDLKR